MNVPELFREITAALGKDAEVCRFYSDVDNIVVSSRRGIKEVSDIMLTFGYEYYDAGASDGSIMITYKRKS